MDVLRRNNVTVSGASGPVLMFAHGFGCDQEMWRQMADSFAGRNRVVLFDHVGAGAADASSYCSDKYGRLDGYAADVVEICEALGHSEVIFVGHSVSATIGVLAAVRRPDLFAGLVLICPSPRYTDTDTYSGGFKEADIDELLELLEINNLDWSSVIAPVVLGPDNLDAQARWRQSVHRADPAIAKAFARTTFKSDHRAEFRQVRTPTLIINCSSDNLAPREVAAWVRNAIKGSRMVTLEAAGHCPHMTAPADVIRIIGNFVPGDQALCTGG